MATRMVSTLFVLLTVLAVGTAQKGCCFPEQYVADSGGVMYKYGVQVVNTIDFYGQTAFDAPNNRQAQIVQRTAAGKVLYRNVWDYNKQLFYSIEDNGHKCKKMPLLSVTQVRCIPDNAGYQGNGYLADHKLSVRSWTYGRHPLSRNNTVKTTLVVSMDECIPLSSTLITSDDASAAVSFLAATAFTNYTKGIPDPAKFFPIPKSCSQDFYRGIPDLNIRIF